MQPHRSNALDGAAAALSFDSGTHARVLWPVHHSAQATGSWCCGVGLISLTTGPRVSGCIRDPASGLRDTLNREQSTLASALGRTRIP